MKKQHADSIFVQRLLDNEESAWEEFALRFHNCIHGAIFEQFRNRPIDNKAVAQDFFIDFYINSRKKLEAFRGDSSFETYIWSICRNFCRNIAKSRKKLGLYLFGENPDLEEIRRGESYCPPDMSLEDIEISEILKGKIAELTKNEKTVIELYFFEEMKEQEIAEMLGKSPGWVASYKKRGLEMLKRLLKNFKEL